MEVGRWSHQLEHKEERYGRLLMTRNHLQHITAHVLKLWSMLSILTEDSPRRSTMLEELRRPVAMRVRSVRILSYFSRGDDGPRKSN